MPSFRVEIDHVIDYDFEVFCGTCGADLCGQSDTRTSRSRGFPQITVDVCSSCKKEWEEKIDHLNQIKDDLQNEVNSLRSEIEHWEKFARKYRYV